MRVISICCLIILTNQCSFSCKNYYDYINNNIPNFINNINKTNNNSNNFLENCKIILINTKDIKKRDSRLVNKVIICNGKILNNDRLIPGDCYKVIIKKPNHKRIFEKLLNNNKKQNTINSEEDIDVLASFRLNQIIKNFENSNKKEDNTRDWREEFWSDRTLILLDSKENSITDSAHKTIDEQNISNNSTNDIIQNEYKQVKDNISKNNQILDDSIQCKIDRLNRLHKEFAIKNAYAF